MRPNIPATSALVVLTTSAAACGDPAVGDWQATEATYDGEPFPVFAQRSNTSDGRRYLYTNRWTLSLAKDGTGDVSEIYDYEVDGVLVDVVSTRRAFEFTSERLASGSFEITTEAIRGDAMVMTCTAAGDMLGCEGSWGAPWSVDWARLDPEEE